MVVQMGQAPAPPLGDGCRGPAVDQERCVPAPSGLPAIQALHMESCCFVPAPVLHVTPAKPPLRNAAHDDALADPLCFLRDQTPLLINEVGDLQTTHQNECRVLSLVNIPCPLQFNRCVFLLNKQLPHVVHALPPELASPNDLDAYSRRQLQLQPLKPYVCKDAPSRAAQPGTPIVLQCLRALLDANEPGAPKMATIRGLQRHDRGAQQ